LSANDVILADDATSRLIYGADQNGIFVIDANGNRN
jgi:hypothetical protein